LTVETVSDVACKLLREAAVFFLNVGGQNPALAQEMADNAEVYRQVADILEVDPGHRLDPDDGTTSDAALSDVAARMLDDAATLLVSVGAQNPALANRMDDDAGVFRTVAELLRTDPGHRLPLDS